MRTHKTHPLCIVGMGATGALGLSPDAIASAVMGELSAFEMFDGAPWGLPVAIRAAMCPLLDRQTDADARLRELLLFTLSTALSPLNVMDQSIELGLSLPNWADCAALTEGYLAWTSRSWAPTLAARAPLYEQGHSSASLRVLAALAERLLAPVGERPTLVIWAGVDSMIHGHLLSALEKSGLLSSERNTAGVVPSEGAAAVVLTHQEDAERLGLPILGRISVPTRQKTTSDAGAFHQALTEALTQTLAEEAEPSITHLWSDATFLPARAIALGQALAVTQSITDSCQVVTPSAHLGELGAAFGPMAAAIAIEAMAAGLVPQGQGVICTADDSMSAACRLEGSWRHPVMLADRPDHALSEAS